MMAFCAICGRDHPVGPCAGNPINFGRGAESRERGRLDPTTIKRTERTVAVVVLIVAVALIVWVYFMTT